MVKALSVFSQNGHVHHAGLPYLSEAPVDFVRHAIVKFDRPDIGKEVKTASQAKNDRATGEVAVG